MTYKKSIEYILKNKGRCDRIKHCSSCVLKRECDMCLNNNIYEYSLEGTNFLYYRYIYEYFLTKYIKIYGIKNVNKVIK